MEIYKNKRWLEKKYLKEELSRRQIAKICGISNDLVIYYWLKKYNIPCRSNGEGIHLATGNHCQLSQKAIEWINGELLGDGCLQSYSPYSANFQYGSKHLEYIEYISDTLESFGIRGGRIYKIKNKKSNKYDNNYRSKCYIELLSIRKKWYPEGKKIIPKDIELTPLTCRQWYIGDGCLKQARNKDSRGCIELATCGFTILDVGWLVEQLNNLGFKATRQPRGNIITISVHSIKKFFDYLGKCPVECYGYKWI